MTKKRNKEKHTSLQQIASSSTHVFPSQTPSSLFTLLPPIASITDHTIFDPFLPHPSPQTVNHLHRWQNFFTSSSPPNYLLLHLRHLRNSQPPFSTNRTTTPHAGERSKPSNNPSPRLLPCRRDFWASSSHRAAVIFRWSLTVRIHKPNLPQPITTASRLPFLSRKCCEGVFIQFEIAVPDGVNGTRSSHEALTDTTVASSTQHDNSRRR